MNKYSIIGTGMQQVQLLAEHISVSWRDGGIDKPPSSDNLNYISTL